MNIALILSMLGDLLIALGGAAFYHTLTYKGEWVYPAILSTSLIIIGIIVSNAGMEVYYNDSAV